ncbi:MAG TPA: response regulator [Steroidobacteraceae bacterium]|nr:response regulator [Steroidobacteraceae bacterium]
MSQTILLVEDNTDDAELFARSFHRTYANVSLPTVSDGEAARDYLAGNGPYADRSKFPLPNIVLLDVKLPRLSGFELLSWIRQHPQLRRLLVVMLTSSRESVDVRRAYDLGANSYLVKPIALADMQQLASALGLYWLKLNEAVPAGTTP